MELYLCINIYSNTVTQKTYTQKKIFRCQKFWYYNGGRVNIKSGLISIVQDDLSCVVLFFIPCSGKFQTSPRLMFKNNKNYI